MSKWLSLCLVILAGCSLNSAPIHAAANAGAPASDGDSPTGTLDQAAEREDAGAPDAAKDSADEDGPIATGSAGSDATDDAPATTAEPRAGSPAVPSKPAAGAGAAVGGKNAGSAGAAAAGASGASAPDAGAADGGTTNLRGSLVDQVWSAFEDRGQGTVEIYMLLDDLRRMAASGQDLSAPFVQSLLDAMKKSGLCLTDRRTCAGICATIGQDCKECAQDMKCKATLTEVCGPVVGCIFAP